YFPMVENPDVAAVLARAYNDWVHALAQQAPERLFPVAVLPLQSVYFARRELERVAGLGFKSVLLRPMFYAVPPNDMPSEAPAGAGWRNPNPRGVYITDDYFRSIWNAIEDLGLVASVHPSMGITNPEPTSVGSFIDRVAARLQIGHTVV